MKKLISLIITILLITFSLSACGIETASQHTERTSKEAESIAKEQESLLAAQESTGESTDISSETGAQSETSAETKAGASSPSSNTSASSSRTSNTAPNNSSPAPATQEAASAQTPGSSGSASGGTDTAAYITVHFSITCYNIKQYASENSNINSSGVILSKDIVLPAGSSVFTALKNSGIEYTVSSSYIRSINDIPEKLYSGTSGWLYRVNGNAPGVGAKSYTVNDNSTIEFYYVVSESDN